MQLILKPCFDMNRVGLRSLPFVIFAILVLGEVRARLSLTEYIVVRFALNVWVNDDHQLAAGGCKLVLHVDRSREVVLIPCEVPAHP